MALRVRGETIEEITGAVARHARQNAARRRRRRARSTSSAPAATDIGHLQCLDAGRADRRGLPACRSPSMATAPLRRGPAERCAGRARRQDRPRAGARSSLHCREAGIGFMSAQTHHAAMRHVGPGARRTRHAHDFQSARAARQSGRRQAADCSASSPPSGWSRWRRCCATSAPSASGSSTASDGLDEVTTTGPSYVTALENGAIRSFEISPEEAGLKPASLADLKGGDAGA